jgi:hypothetical protein
MGAFDTCSSLVNVYLPARFANTYISFSLTASQVNFGITLTASCNSSEGTILVNPIKIPYEAGESVIVTATPKAGYLFSNWSGASTATTSSITFLDGEEGILKYRGYPIEELAEKARNEQAAKAQKQTNDLLAKEAQKRADLENIQNMMNGLNDPRFGQSIQSTLKSLSSTAEGIENVDDLFHSIHSQFDINNQLNLTAKDANDAPGIQKADREIAATLSMLSQAQQGMEGFEASKLDIDASYASVIKV